MGLIILLSVCSIAVTNYLCFRVKGVVSNKIMICAAIGVIADLLILQIIKAAIQFGILLYIRRKRSISSRCRKCLIALLPHSLMEIIS